MNKSPKSQDRLVFISYATEDLDIAVKVCDGLEMKNMVCWIAPRDIDAGTDYPSAIVAALKSTSVVVLVLSASSNKSKDVAREIAIAFKKGERKSDPISDRGG